MDDKYKSMIEDALAAKAVRAAIIDSSEINFYEELRNMCGLKTCGNYDKNWMCPPACQPFNELKNKVQKYEKGFVFQTLYQLEDSFDYEGMSEAKKIFDKIFRVIIENFKNKYNYKDILPIGAGACEICKICSYLEKKPCRFPDKAISSVESYGINVTELLNSCDIPYYHGINTVAYVGIIMFNNKKSN